MPRRKGTGFVQAGVIWNTVFRELCSDEGALGGALKKVRSWIMCYVGENIPGSRHSKGKGSEAPECVAGLRDSQAASVAVAECWRDRGGWGAREEPGLITHDLWAHGRLWLLSVFRWEDVGGFWAGDIMIHFHFKKTTGVGYRLNRVYESRGGRSRRSMVKTYAII